MLNVTYAPSRVLIIFKTKKLRKKDCGSAVCTLSTAHDPDCYDCRCDKVSAYHSKLYALAQMPAVLRTRSQRNYHLDKPQLLYSLRILVQRRWFPSTPVT